MSKSIAKQLDDCRDIIEKLETALERAELKLQQFQQKDKLAQLHISQLESIIILVRNAVTPRGDRLFAEDLTKEKANGIQEA